MGFAAGGSGFDFWREGRDVSHGKNSGIFKGEAAADSHVARGRHHLCGQRGHL